VAAHDPGKVSDFMSVERPLRSLIIDADAGSAECLRVLLERWGHDVRVAADGRTAEVLARVWRPDLVLLELVLPDAGGVALIPRLRTGDDPPPVVIVSSHATVRVTVDALAAGAASVLEKPVDVELLQDVLARLSNPRSRADAAIAEPLTELGGMVTRDPRMRALFDTIRLAGPSGVNILVQGENGTGKELVAAALHELSPRAAGPFVKVNCAAIPAGLLESELFGHERGAFTGAVAGRKGLFEQSNRGSILLDEIAEMPLALQVKLLRVLQEREIRPVGGTTPIKADFRLICATNVDVTQAVAAGRLRQDLYFRLNTIALQIPPLRQRVCDIAPLASQFLRRFAAAHGRSLERFSDHALRVLEEYAWPGNVRELEHVVERAVILAVGSRIEAGDLPATLRQLPVRTSGEVSVPAGCSLEEVERLAIVQTLELTDWNKRQAAKILGIHRPTLYNKLRKYRLWRREDRFRREPLESVGQ
jgi:two-component system, NtrC family, response regulator HydG